MWTWKSTKVILFVTEPDDQRVLSEAVLLEPWRLKTVILSVANPNDPWLPSDSLLPEPWAWRPKIQDLGWSPFFPRDEKFASFP